MGAVGYAYECKHSGCKLPCKIMYFSSYRLLFEHLNVAVNGWGWATMSFFWMGSWANVIFSNGVARWKRLGTTGLQPLGWIACTIRYIWLYTIFFSKGWQKSLYHSDLGQVSTFLRSWVSEGGQGVLCSPLDFEIWYFFGYWTAIVTSNERARAISFICEILQNSYSRECHYFCSEAGLVWFIGNRIVASSIFL